MEFSNDLILDVLIVFYQIIWNQVWLRDENEQSCNMLEPEVTMYIW